MRQSVTAITILISVGIIILTMIIIIDIRYGIPLPRIRARRLQAGLRLLSGCYD
jgi:hypothetical protein